MLDGPAKTDYIGTTVACPKCGLELDAGVPICPNDGTKVIVLPKVGEFFQGKYEFLERHAAGGMGVVYKAWQNGVNRLVAIKILQSINPTANAARRFQKEAQALGALDHRNLVRVYESGVTDYGHLYTVMEFIDGKGLDEVIDLRGRLPFAKAINILVQISDALAYVHSKGICHRDLKPSNVMLVNPDDEYPVVKLVDFGIAKFIADAPLHTLTQTGEFVGSPAYMSPEQARGGVTDERSDLYSLGCVMYEILAGEPPFSGNSFIEVLMAQVADNPQPINAVISGQKLPNSVEAVLSRLLEKNPDERYQSADELSIRLKSLIDQQRGGGYHIAVSKLQPKKYGVWIALSVAIVGLALIWPFYWALNLGPVKEPAPTQTVDEIPLPIENILDVSRVAGPKGDLSLYAVLRQKEILDLRVAHPDAFLHLKDRKDHYVTQFCAGKITDEGVASIPDFPLHLLDIHGSAATRACIPTVVKFAGLTHLNLGEISLQKSDCEELLKLPILNELRLSSCGLDDDCVKALSKLPHLNILVLSVNRITDKATEHLADAGVTAYELELDGTKITDRSIENLAKLPNLEKLILARTSLTDAGLQGFEKMNKLRYLDLSQTRVTAQGLSHLKVPRLFRLILNKGFKNETIKAIKKNNPTCLVYPYESDSLL